jgi:hypothetical protein
MTKFGDWLRARESVRLAELERISHAELVQRLGYRPDEALVRTRTAMPPDLPKVAGRREQT